MRRIAFGNGLSFTGWSEWNIFIYTLKAAQSKPGVELLPWLEREFTLHAMKATRGNQVRAAKLLGITRATLRKRIERFGITKELTIQ
jgi:two-component system nitrogen regulation response regulator GlnG